MIFDALLKFVVHDTAESLRAFRPELALCATIVVVLLAGITRPRWTSGAFYLTLIGLVAAMFLALWPLGAVQHAQAIFSGTLQSDGFGATLRLLLLLFAVLFVTFTQMAATTKAGPSGGDNDATEFHVLVLGALLGMCLMISANHVLLVLLGVEMASVPCYVLAGMKRNSPKASEAAMKYAVFGAGAAGIMLYGLSLLSGALSSTQLPEMTLNLARMLNDGVAADRAGALVLGGLMVTVGVAFKLSAVPFHFWAPDVFEGATAEVAAFLSVASKAAALGLLVRLAAGFAMPAGIALAGDPVAVSALVESLAPVRRFIVALISVLAAVTCTFGNLAAYGQTNMKRLLAYSTIAHAGYMMMPVAAAIALAGTDPVEARSAIAALVVYIAIYLFMNLAAFAIVAFLRNAIGSEEIADYAGLVRTSPGLSVCMAIVMFSLVGLPPLAGFQGKLVVFGSLVQAGLWLLLFIGILNSVLSLFYYLRVVKVMTFAPEPLYRRPPAIPLRSMVGLYCALLTAPIVVLFFLLDGLWRVASAAASTLF